LVVRCSRVSVPPKEAGGIDIIWKIEAALLDGVGMPTNSGLMYVDLYGYDNFVAEETQKINTGIE
jgi:hypothetical protein